MKTCVACQVSKDLSEFTKHSVSKDGLAARCRVCKRLYDNEYYRNNPSRKDYIRENSDRRIAECRTWLYQYLSEHPCVDCGEPDIVVLEFDHVGDKNKDISTLLRTANLKTLQNEIKQCVVRCANCHRRKTAQDFGSWRLTSVGGKRSGTPRNPLPASLV